jgi:hypothetical protein
MKKFLIIAGGLISGATLMFAAAPAMARVDVQVHLGAPGLYAVPEPVYMQPRPVYVQPRPVYVQPRPVYVQPQPVYVQPRPVYVQPQPVYDDWRSRREWREHRWHERQVRGYRDRDRDGVPNYRDRDRDGDGIPNRFDQRPNNPYRY